MPIFFQITLSHLILVGSRIRLGNIRVKGATSILGCRLRGPFRLVDVSDYVKYSSFKNHSTVVVFLEQAVI
uniref:Uncharacterized protein n=1 Tax=Pararge aegeria TaxID=116150 RepID=S4NW86_9NEOP